MFKLFALLALVLVVSFTVRAEEAKKPSTITPMQKDPKRHEQFLAVAKKGDIDLLFLGDSITDGWRGGGKKVWETNFAPLKAANFGISGDRTEHVLWRIENGELEGIDPKVVILMIGTNNSNTNSPEEIADAI